MRHAPRSQPTHRTFQEAEAAAALLALLEQELHADADPEGRPALCDALSQRARNRPEATGGALDVADARDHRERGLEHLGRIRRDDRRRACTTESRAHAAQVARAVVAEHDLHESPFVDRTPASPDAQASRNARPSALKAASATW